MLTEFPVGSCITALARVVAENTTFCRIENPRGWLVESKDDGTPVLEHVIREVPAEGTTFVYRVNEGCTMHLRETASMEIPIQPTMMRQTVCLKGGAEFDVDRRVRAEQNVFLRLRRDPNPLSFALQGWGFELGEAGELPVVQFLGVRGAHGHFERVNQT